MTRKPTGTAQRIYANLSVDEAAAGVARLRRRLSDVEALPDPVSENDASTSAASIAAKINANLREVFGPETVEAQEYRISPSVLTVNFMNFDRPHPLRVHVEEFQKGKFVLVSKIKTIIDILEEKAAPEAVSPGSRAIAAYKSLDLHEVVASAASDLYEDGHFANAIVDAVKALNNLVRLRSGSELDGEKLMTSVFSPEKPMLRFNDLQDQSDKDEQRGFMMLFAGAVSGLRNPRAHKLITDDAERALEFIAFVSLLAKLLDGAKRVRSAA